MGDQGMSDEWQSLDQINRRFASPTPKSVHTLLSRTIVKTNPKPAATEERPATTGPEHIDSRELARRWSVSKRWVEDQTRSKDDPIPCMKRGRIIRYLWNASDPQNTLNLWWSRHTKVQPPSHQK